MISVSFNVTIIDVVGIDRILGSGGRSGPGSLHTSLKSHAAHGPVDPSTLDLPEGNLDNIV